MAASCHTRLPEPPDVFDRDAALMLQAKLGDDGAFARLFMEHRAPVQRFVYRMVRDRTEAEDITQENSRSRFHQPLELAHSKRPHRYFIDRSARIDEWLLFQNTVADLHSAIEELPDRQKRIVFLHKFKDMGCGEIARMLGCSNQAVRSTLCRAYSHLRARLAGSEGGALAAASEMAFTEKRDQSPILE